jgi:ribosomal protein S18 acetylase RimI-like enzyme
VRARLSSWDSDVFGVRVGIRDEWHPSWTADDIRKANPDLDVVFVKAHGWIDPPAGTIAADHLYGMEARTGFTDRSTVVSGMISPKILDIAEGAFEDSRFLRDSALAPKVGAFYRRWCVDAKDRILVLKGNEGHAFMVEGRDDEATGRIELIAVHPDAKGYGLGSDLVMGAMARPGGPSVWRVTVSSRNWRALRFYEKTGFSVKCAFTAFHIWRLP